MHYGSVLSANMHGGAHVCGLGSTCIRNMFFIQIALFLFLFSTWVTRRTDLGPAGGDEEWRCFQ